MTTIIVLIEAVLVFMLIVLLTIAVRRTLSRPDFKRAFEDQLDAQLNSSEFAKELADGQLIASKVDGSTWSGYWLKLVLNTGRVVKTAGGPSQFVLVGAVLSGGIGGLLTLNPIVGFIAPFAFVLVIRFWLNREAKKRRETMDLQLPALISGLRANLQAAGTPQQALFAVAEDTPSPLGDELRIVKAQMRVNVPLDVALKGMANRVESREVKFLCSSIEIAVQSGADLEPQLKVIGEVVVQRARIANKIKAAVSSAKPTIIAAGLAVPAMFFNSIRDAENRGFWFGSYVGVLTAAVVAVLWGLGLYISSLLVKQVVNT